MVIYQLWFEKKGTSKKSKKLKLSSEAPPIQVLTDIYLSLLGKANAEIRQMTEKSFRVFCVELDDASLELLLDVNLVVQSGLINC